MLVEILLTIIVTLLIINFFFARIIWKTFRYIDEGDKEIAKTFHEHYLGILELRKKIEEIKRLYDSLQEDRGEND